MLKEQIDEFYHKREKTRFKERKAFYVTDIASCPRAIFFEFKKYPKKARDPRILRVMHNGDYVHQRLGEVLKQQGVLKGVPGEDLEVPLPYNDLIHGRADAVIELSGEKWVIDFKSMNYFQFKDLLSPDLHHIQQVQLYLHFLNIRKGLLVYECKNSQEIKEFEVSYDENIVNESLAYFYMLRSKIEQNIIPEVPPDIEQWKCERCPFLESCRKVGNPFFKQESEKL
ncbi:MAG TPA: CRISPR-associated protein Cas4 [Candidatus Nanoarchaeia archaeon]|nr:CRISPR-associated protein Cas4 [Candidatus Nanoarchaeia archaeon]